MTKTPTARSSATIGMTVTRIAGTAAVALAMLLSISAAIQPAAAQVVAPLPAVQVTEPGIATGSVTAVTFKRYGGYRGHSFRGGHRFGGFGFKKPGYSHGSYGSRFGSTGIKKFGHSGVFIKKHGTRIHGYRGKTFKPHGYHGHSGFRRY